MEALKYNLLGFCKQRKGYWI